MKHTGKCPKCSSTEIIADAKAIDRGESNIQFDFSVATFKNPNAFLSKDKRQPLCRLGYVPTADMLSSMPICRQAFGFRTTSAEALLRTAKASSAEPLQPR
jgi:hypothetical protein